MNETIDHSDFLGTWELLPASCQFQQGDPPGSGVYVIEDLAGGAVRFTLRLTHADGAEVEVCLEGPPDGSRQPFAGGELADAMAILAVSARELNSYAYYGGRELMVAQRQLDDTRQHMRVIQAVRLPDGTRPVNVSIYRRVLEH